MSHWHQNSPSLWTAFEDCAAVLGCHVAWVWHSFQEKFLKLSILHTQFQHISNIKTFSRKSFSAGTRCYSSAVNPLLFGTQIVVRPGGMVSNSAIKSQWINMKPIVGSESSLCWHAPFCVGKGQGIAWIDAVLLCVEHHGAVEQSKFW